LIDDYGAAPFRKVSSAATRATRFQAKSGVVGVSNDSVSLEVKDRHHVLSLLANASLSNGHLQKIAKEICEFRPFFPRDLLVDQTQLNPSGLLAVVERATACRPHCPDSRAAVYQHG
jgi:hypothetical protein